MKKDKLYFLTFLSIAVIFLIIAAIASQYFIKVSANQLIEVQVESSKREANEVSKIVEFQLLKGVEKEEIVNNIQQIISNSNRDTWFISVFNWGGKEVCHPDITKVGQKVSSNQTLLLSLKEKNNSDDLYELLVKSKSSSSEENPFEVIHISPIKNSDLIELIYQSSANYILAKLKTINARQFQEKLKPYKIMIRNCQNFDFLDDSYVRIAVKSSNHLSTLKKALEEIC